MQDRFLYPIPYKKILSLIFHFHLFFELQDSFCFYGLISWFVGAGLQWISTNQRPASSHVIYFSANQSSVLLRVSWDRPLSQQNIWTRIKIARSRFCWVLILILPWNFHDMGSKKRDDNGNSGEESLKLILPWNIMTSHIKMQCILNLSKNAYNKWKVIVIRRWFDVLLEWVNSRKCTFNCHCNCLIVFFYIYKT